ncbi:class III poly(R)-hydroxyalkanoic acid synthase subunit PhaE [Pseudoxanthomonas putridarboris]|uniref:Poly(3-hydroxyalkanoate) polymerase subunit PhaE n=1 Tax=Pseudoxanthomonas putridarboris TaxID=752605 RepID=A0ABU9IYW1_9GAMM
MANFAPQWPGDFESVARQYWSLWGDALRQAGGAAPTPTPGWQQAVDWWSQLMPGGTGQVQDVLGRFQRQAGDWFGQMQQVAAQFAGRDHGPADITRAWREALGMADPQPAHNPFADIFRAMQGSGAHGLDGWMEQARPYIDAMQRENARWMHLPTFGLSREQQERWQQLAQAQQDYQHQVGEYDRLMLKVAQQAFELFEQKLAAHSAPGQQLDSARALFDLWVDAAEEAYAEIALSADFRKVYGALANAQMRLRLSVQREVEQVCALFGMPTRTEVDSAHRKIVELERALRKARQSSAPRTAAPRQPPVPEAAAPTAETVEEPAVTATPRRAAQRPQAAAKKTVARKTSRSARRKRTVKAKPAPARASRAAAAPVARQAKKAASASTRTPAAKKTAAKKAPPVKAKSAKTGPAKPKKAAVRKPAPKTSKPATQAAVRPSAAVVSMKDWVARNAARAAMPSEPPKQKKKARRGSRK